MEIGIKTSVDPSLVKFLAPSRRAALHNEIGGAFKELIADHIGRASVSRHKTADRLGAPHTKYLEFAVGRIGSVGHHIAGSIKPDYVGNKAAPAVSATNGSTEAVVSITNAEGLMRAYAPMTIRPVRKKMLTIPIAAESYGRSVADMKSLGWKIHREGSALVGRNGKNKTALYALKLSVTLPQDAGLMPTDSNYNDWAADVTEAFLIAESFNS